MKKLGIAICLSSALLASAAQAWEGNWLLGASTGYSAREGKNYITIIDGTSGRQSNVTFREYDNNWTVGVLGGYQLSCNRWVMGLEANVDWREDDNHPFAFTDTSNVGWQGFAKYERDWIVGLTARLGYEIAPYLMPYIRVGGEWHRDEINLNISRPLGGLQAVLNGKRDVFRVVGGIGIEMPMAAIPVLSSVSFLSHLAVRLEYDYHSTGRSVGATGTTNVGGTLVSSSMNPHEQSGILALVWNF